MGSIATLLKCVVLILMCLYFAGVELAFHNCLIKSKRPVFNPELEVLRYGKPTAYVTTKSIRFSPYVVTDPFRQSSLYHEYLLVGPGVASADPKLTDPDLVGHNILSSDYEEEIHLLLYDLEAIQFSSKFANLIHQNLGKEYMFALINATGMLPSMTISNTTFEKTFRFHTEEDNRVAYKLAYPHLFRTKQTTPPLDVIIEFPAKTRMFQTLKTMIDYQTFGLLRWRLTPAEPVDWRDLKQYSGEWLNTIDDPALCAFPAQNETVLRSADYMRCIYNKRWDKLENPCIKDMIILYTLRGQTTDNSSSDDAFLSVTRLFITVPMIYEYWGVKGWLDLTEVYCPRPDLNEECGEPEDVALTNDHFLILTDRGLWVSNSLNESRTNVSLPYSMKPLAKWTPIDPCSQFDFFNCSEINAPVLIQQTFKRHRVFYTPICHLYQYPVYEDMVMLVYEHVSQAPDKSCERDVFTVMYASKPYNDWKILFYARYEYVTKEGPLPIKEIVGVWFNHHRRQFDLAVILTEETGKERTFRFVLPLPKDPNFKGYQELNGLLGNGFLEFEFPEGFTMTGFTVNPEALDIFYMGNQIWVAEAAGAFLYLSLPEVSDAAGNRSIVSECSFNHPDRTFVCLEKSHSVMYPGRVGVQYSPVSVLFERIYELRFTMYHNLWPYTYRQYIALLGSFVVGYSGKIMLWFLYDANDVAYSQQIVVNEMGSTYKYCDDEDYIANQPVNCYVCKGLLSIVNDNNCTIEFAPPEEFNVEFKMLAFDPSVLQGRDWISAGPLVPFLVDGDKVILFEVTVPELDFYKPDYDYFEDVDVGNRIYCRYQEGESELETGTGSGPSKPIPPPVNSTNTTNPGGRRKRSAENEDYMALWEQEDDNADERFPRQTGSNTTITVSGSGGPQDVTCPSLTQDKSKVKCELYIRHMKKLRLDGEQKFLKGFRRTLFATVISSFPMRPIPTDMVVVILPNSNDAIIQLGETMFDVVTFNKYLFSYQDVGQTLYIPDHFSVLLLGFPKFLHCSTDPPPPGEILLHDMLRMVGLATRYYRQGIKIQLKPFEAFLIDFSTPDFCEYYKKSLLQLNSTQCDRDPSPKDVTTQKYHERRIATNDARNEAHANRKKFNLALNEYYQSFFYDPSTAPSGDWFKELVELDPTDYYTMEELLLYESLAEPAVGKFTTNFLMLNVSYNVNEAFSPEFWKHNGVCNQSSWQVVDGGCHLRLYLSKNPVLKQNGGRISLDKFDSLSFQLKLRPLTTLGKSLIHRSLIAVTNTNPDVLTVEQVEAQGKDIQIMNITLTPTGYGVGVATVSIRPLIVSPLCLFADGSFTLIVQVQRAPGRRLHVNYPVPRCKPTDDDEEYQRPWKVDLPDCVKREEILEKREVRRPDDEDIGQVFYSELPVNYRPPSPRGSEIPMSKNVYHVDPSKPDYKRIYRISKETGELTQCKEKRNREECACSINDELSEDSYYTDCKRMVYTAKRGFRVDINVEYDRVMRDEDQHQTFFLTKKNWTVYVEEVNSRVEFSLSGTSSPYLELIHNSTHLNQGRHHFDAKTLGVTLHGTGLFHFKVVLASFESFGEVSGHFMIYIPNNELNHIQLVVIMLLTITVCMMFVFLGFLIVRRRLSSQLPFQPRTNDKSIKLE